MSAFTSVGPARGAVVDAAFETGDRMGEWLRDWNGLDFVGRPVTAERSSADLIAVVAVSAIGLLLSLVAIALPGLPVSALAEMG